MKIYYCECCNYTANQKSHYDKHMRSKRHAQNHSTFSQKNVSIKEKTIKCLHCEKMFTTKRSMNRHVKTSCKVVKDQHLKSLEAKFEAKINELNKKVEELSKNNKVNTINNINNGVINNITINAYDDTDISYLTDNDYRNCLKQRYMCIPSMVGKIHCNPSHPENMNIVIKNFKNAFLDIFQGKQWNRFDREHELRRLVIRTTGKLEDWLNSLPDDSEYDHLRTLGDMVISGTEDEAILDRIFKDLKLILYNNRNFMIESKDFDNEEAIESN